MTYSGEKRGRVTPSMVTVLKNMECGRTHQPVSLSNCLYTTKGSSVSLCRAKQNTSYVPPL